MKYIYFLLICVSISGCQTYKNMDIRYNILIDPDYQLSSEAKIVVLANESVMESKFYVAKVVEELKKRGFNNVYSYKDKDVGVMDVAVFIRLSKQTSSYEYQGADLGMVNSGTTTTSCTGYGYTLNCTENQGKTIGITGYSTRRAYVTGYYFNANWYELESKKEILRMQAASYIKNCTDRGVYEFIISESIKAMDLKKPSEKNYVVKMPKEYNCNY